MTKSEHFPGHRAGDVEALCHLIGTYAFIAAEHTVDEMYEALELEDSKLSRTVRERVGKIPDEVAAEVIAYYLTVKHPETKRSGTWEDVGRVVLERMQGNPAARPTPASG